MNYPSSGSTSVSPKLGVDQPKQPVLLDKTTRIKQLIWSAASHISRVEEAINRLEGAVPTAAGNKAETERVPNNFQQNLDELVMIAEVNEGRLIVVVERLEQLI